MIRRVLAAVVVVVVAAILLVAAWPQLFRLQDAAVVAQVVSLRGLDVAIAVTLALVFGLIAAFWARARRLSGTLALLLLGFIAVSVIILGSRGFGDSTAVAKKPADLTVLTWNTKGDAPGAKAIAQLALANDADIVTLPETTQITGVAVAKIMKAAGRPMWVYSAAYDYVSKSRSTTLLVSTKLGEYTVQKTAVSTAVLPTVIATPDDGTGPTIVAVHAVSPIPREMRNWRNDLRWLSTRCAGSNIIMAGDFNATLDHLNPLATASGADFGDCTDAGSAANTGAVGSWPTDLPPLAGAQIDHVFSGSHWQAVSARVIVDEDSSGSDHRPVVAVLRPTKQTG
jgi:endonuclease/exonuclease/phosphatase (EEP) superfamily protein YafD